MIHELSIQMPIDSGFPIAMCWPESGWHQSLHQPSDFGRFLEIDTGHAPRALLV